MANANALWSKNTITSWYSSKMTSPFWTIPSATFNQMANNNKFDWKVEVDEAVEDDIRIPTMIIQPFIENAIIHGVKPLEDIRGIISVYFKMNGNKVECIVSDNGIGRKAASKNKKGDHKSVAIEVVNERLRTKLSMSNQSPIQYKDVLNENGEVCGTEVTIQISTV